MPNEDELQAVPFGDLGDDLGEIVPLRIFRDVSHWQSISAAMTPEERQEVDRIVEQMKDEKDQAKFADLLSQFNEIINRKQRRLQLTSDNP